MQGVEIVLNKYLESLLMLLSMKAVTEIPARSDDLRHPIRGGV